MVYAALEILIPSDMSLQEVAKKDIVAYSGHSLNLLIQFYKNLRFNIGTRYIYHFDDYNCSTYIGEVRDNQFFPVKEGSFSISLYGLLI